MSEEEERVFSSKDVQDVAGLSYRQINDWDSRGVLPHGRDEAGGWRRFSPRDIFTLLVVNEIHSKFGIPVNRLGFVREFMMQDGANHLRVAAELMSTLGVGVWIMTDLEDTFIMDSELEMIDLWTHAYFGGDKDQGYVFIKVNPLVNRLLACLKEPIHLDAHGRGYEILAEIRRMFYARTDGELAVLEAIRSGDFRKVEVTLDSGDVKTIRTTTTRAETERLADILAEHDFQKLIVTKQNGRVVAVEQQATEKVNELCSGPDQASSPQHRGEPPR